jgi:hypothetical protein
MMRRQCTERSFVPSLGPAGSARKVDRAPRAALCEAAWGAAPTNDTSLPAKLRHLWPAPSKGSRPRPCSRSAMSLVIAWPLVVND